MSKLIGKLLSLIIIFSFGIFSLQGTTYAAGNCVTDYRIVYTPSYFLENQPITLNFAIRDSNIVNQLNGKKVRLHFITPIISFIGLRGYDSDPITINNNTFSIPLPKHSSPVNYDPTGGGLHKAVLDWSPDGNNFTELCKDIEYQVGAGDSCTLGSLPNRVPPGTTLNVNFFGRTNTKYYLFMDQHTLTPVNAVGERNTDIKGQGTFENVKFDTKDGTKITLRICSDQFTSNCNDRISCEQDILVTISAPAPTAPKSGDVLSPADPLARGTTAPIGQPTLGGGIPCGTPTSPALETAIGCIHTNPVEFAKDFMTFAIGISGGLAFLMMLLGAFGMLTSNGNPDTLKAGQERMTSAIIGLLFVIFAVLLLQIIGAGILNIPGFK